MQWIEESGEVDPKLFNEILSRRKMNNSISKKEQLANKIYDDYCEAVGGKAFNGDPLPKSQEFFSDPNKTKQSNAWIVAAETAIDFLEYNL
jgi:transcriptional regulator of met regulon